MTPASGWPVLIAVLLTPPLLLLGGAGLDAADVPEGVIGLGVAIVGVAWLICLCGFYIVNPNMSRVMVLFGNYRGTVRKPGFWWTNPFTVKNKLSLRAHNVSSEKIKVNDSVGNPIEIGAVVV